VLTPGLTGTGGGAGSGNPMSFFVTSAGSGRGADLGGLAGADRICQSLAQAAGAGGRTWRAYLSASAAAACDRCLWSATVTARSVSALMFP